MKKALNLFKKNTKLIFGIFIGLSLGSIGVATAMTIASKEVSYTHSLSNITNVQEAIEELYTLTKENTPTGHIIVENGVRYTGLNPNNYVSFNGELWRMIGIFDGKMKIIRNESIGDYEWNDIERNDWEKSSLYHYLNTTYYNSLESTSKNMIENATWRIGGYSIPDVTTNAMYGYEESLKGASSSSLTTTGFIGLMSISDYGYASSHCYKNGQSLNNYDNLVCTNTNWLKVGIDEWTLSPSSLQNLYAFYVSAEGVAFFGGVPSSLAVRPSLYLKSNVYIKGGNGTRNDPYFLGI